jgi:pyruvate kinase
MVLKVKTREANRLRMEVLIGGWIRENKGVNIPGVELKYPKITAEDKRNLQFAIKHKVDFIAQSFVCSAQDIIVLKEFIGDKLPGCKIVAKIENHQGIRNINEIMEVSDGIMIARGDMGVCLPIYQLPVIQKVIIRKCNQQKKFVVTATQMLESMVERIRPTRAEVTDIANAILDGTNYLMLSGETAIGKHPVQAVEMMNNIIRYTEESSFVSKRRVIRMSTF